MQAYIDKFRRELLVVLVDSPYNKMKYRNRFKSTMLGYRMQLRLKTTKMQAVRPVVWSVHLAIKR